MDGVVVTVMGMHSMPLNCTLKMAKMVMFRLRIIYNFSETRGRSEGFAGMTAQACVLGMARAGQGSGPGASQAAWVGSELRVRPRRPLPGGQGEQEAGSPGSFPT